MASIVNLDALIPREDFEVTTDASPSQPTQTVQIRDLEKDSFFYKVVRKPDFQRETNEWNYNKIADFILSFLEGDLIPAIILWQGGGNIFAIDGAHRLSSLASWVQDDYGDGLTSKLFYDSALPEEQVKVAEQTRRHIKKAVGSYQDHKDAVAHPDKFDATVVARARRLGSLALQLQWVSGNAEKAEASFFKINQQASPIDKTELRLLQSRNKPNALSARAIIRAGTGHKYWSSFSSSVQGQIEQEAKDINDLLFNPALKTPIKTLDLPVAGRGYSSQTLPLVLELVNITNGVVGKKLADDKNGQTTVASLRKCHQVMKRIAGTHASSLGLHPVVYFYSDSGRYQTTSFFGTLEFVMELERKKKLKAFTNIRKDFEEFLLKYKMFPVQIVWKHGSGLKGYLPMKELLLSIAEAFIKGKTESEIIVALSKESRFDYLQPHDSQSMETKGKSFSTSTKSARFLRDALKDPLRCAICGGLIHFNSISIDHIQRKQDGGLGTVDNAQLTHPYCNTTYKN